MDKPVTVVIIGELLKHHELFTRVGALVFVAELDFQTREIRREGGAVDGARGAARIRRRCKPASGREAGSQERYSSVPRCPLASPTKGLS